MTTAHSLASLLIAGLCAASLSGCGNSKSPPHDASNTDAAATPPPAQLASPPDSQAAPVVDANAAEHEREQALQAREDALAKREAELASRQAAAPKSVSTPRKSSTSASSPGSRSPAATASTAPPSAPAHVPARPIVVPAGTPLPVTLSSEVSTRTAAVGDRIEAHLASDLVIDGRRAVPAGAVVRGSVTQVLSGSHHIGGIPTLALAFDTLEVRSGVSVPIHGAVTEQGKSETARDTAKIVGGAVAGAVIGHQMDGRKGKVIGGIVGGAAGAIAAQKTGGDIDLPAGTALTITLDTSFEVTR